MTAGGKGSCDARTDEARLRRALIILSAAVAANVVFLFAKGSLSETVSQAVFKGDKSRIEHPLMIDKFLSKTAPDGNVLLLFRGFEQNEDVASRIIPLVYFRSVYQCFPRKVFASPDDALVNEGAEPAVRDFNPSQEWSRERGIGTVVTVRCSPGGVISIDVEKLNAPTEGDTSPALKAPSEE